jgi:cyclic pyranopterin phosphate synthase
MNHKFSHINEQGNPKMVDVSEKQDNLRTARARSVVELGAGILKELQENQYKSKKGPIIQTAVIAGISAVKKTADLIPMCHPLAISGVDIDIKAISDAELEIQCFVKITGKTGVEMEALTGASVAALTIYDMCKSYSKGIRITTTELMEKTGGKSDYERA